MTISDLKHKLELVDRLERRDIRAVKEKYSGERRLLLNLWAVGSARFCIGDVIESNGIIIRVDIITGSYPGYGEPYVVFHGPALTKKLKPRADGWVTEIYDDSPNRNIVKIK